MTEKKPIVIKDRVCKSCGLSFIPEKYQRICPQCKELADRRLDALRESQEMMFKREKDHYEPIVSIPYKPEIKIINPPPRPRELPPIYCLYCKKNIRELREESGLRTLFCTPNEGVNFYILRNQICQRYSNPQLKDELQRLMLEGKNYKFGEDKK